MKYFIGFRQGHWMAGNAGLMPCTWSRPNIIQKHAGNFGKMYDLDDVFLINEFPQRCCEMDDISLRKYLLQHGRKIWDKESHMQYMHDAYLRHMNVSRRAIYAENY